MKQTAVIVNFHIIARFSDVPEGSRIARILLAISVCVVVIYFHFKGKAEAKKEGMKPKNHSTVDRYNVPSLDSLCQSSSLMAFPISANASVTWLRVTLRRLASSRADIKPAWISCLRRLCSCL
jgi:hypothetical protein